jgi:hypothetical protein
MRTKKEPCRISVKDRHVPATPLGGTRNEAASAAINIRQSLAKVYLSGDWRCLANLCNAELESFSPRKFNL